jgi:hypothetical protein
MRATIGVLTVCVCLVAPATARADDGGFWDMLFHWDTKFFGYGTDFHLLCYREPGERVKNCEEFFRNFLKVFRPDSITHRFAIDNANKIYFQDIHHEINFRVSLMHSYGQRIPDAKLPPGDLLLDDTRKIWAAKLLGMYYYRPPFAEGHLDVGGGVGFIPIFGADVDATWRGVATASALYSLPWRPVRAWYVRGELSYLTRTISAAGLGHPGAPDIGPGLNPSVTVGFDVRRVGQ